VSDAQAIADALAKDYKSKLEIPYVAAAIAQLHVLSSTAASASGASLDQLLAAITSNPKDHVSRVELAGLLFADGDKEAALEHLLQSIKLDRYVHPYRHLLHSGDSRMTNVNRSWEGGKAKETLFKVSSTAHLHLDLPSYCI
jgi:hypothetical protein